MNASLVAAGAGALLFAASACQRAPAVPPRDVSSQAPLAPHTNAGAAMDTSLLREIAVTRGFQLGAPSHVRLTPDGKALLFLRSEPRVAKQALFEMTLATGDVREIASAESLLGAANETLSAEERARRERLRISTSGLATYELSQDGHRVLCTLSGRLFILERASGQVRELPKGEGPVFDPRFSPDGTKVAYVRQHDVYVVGVDGSPEVAVTKGGTEVRPHGEADFIAQEELDRARGYFWSPDSKFILFEEVDQSKVERLAISDPAHPEREPDRPYYPRPGKTNAEVRFGIARVGANPSEPTWVQWDKLGFPYVATVNWSKGAPPTLLVLDRLQRNAHLLAVDVATGKTTALVREHDEAWVNVDPSVPVWSFDGRHFLWSSDRQGHTALELRTAAGALVRTLSPPGVEYHRFARFTSDGKNVVFAASPEPADNGLYVVQTEGGDPRLLAGGDGKVVSATFGESTSKFVVTTSGRDSLPTTEVQSIDGHRVATVPSVAVTPPFLPAVEYAKVGNDAYRVAIVRPRGWTKGRKYPVIDAAYGGPHATVVTSSALGYMRSQWIADATQAIVVAIDGRGTPRRGREWERAIANKLGSLPVDGHVEALEALGRAYPEMDTGRVGVFGWSFGGYFSAYATLMRPDVFRAGVAGAPPVDWRDYDTAYTERYLGLPEENRSAYDDASLLEVVGRAPKEHRPLLVIHGTADDNVYFFHSLKLVDALSRAHRPVDFMPLAGVTHQLGAPEVSERVWSRVASFFKTNL